MNRNIRLTIKLFLFLFTLPIISLLDRVKIPNKDTYFPKNPIKTNLFEESEFSTTKFNNLKDNEIQNDLKELIKTKLQELFSRENINIEGLKGRIYYDVKESSVEILVLWKTNIHEESYSHYDRFELVL